MSYIYTSQVVDRNEVMLEESHNTITVPSMLSSGYWLTYTGGSRRTESSQRLFFFLGVIIMRILAFKSANFLSGKKAMEPMLNY